MLGEIEKVVLGVTVAGCGLLGPISAIGIGRMAMTVTARPKASSTE